MLAYIFRRLLLIIPTLFGILLINFVIIQAAPGGPVEQMIAKLEGFDGATSRIAGGGAEVSVAGSSYRGAQGLDPTLIQGNREDVRLRQVGAGALVDHGQELRPAGLRRELLSATPRSST
jgi:ABC-type microcin C transport system permease subunit YejB